jgi:hypothetical protein
MINSDGIRTDHAPDFCFDAFSSREPAATSLKNAHRRGDELAEHLDAASIRGFQPSPQLSRRQLI